MKEQNNDDMIMSRRPFGITTRPRRRAYRVINCNDRSPETGAMNAHLRAAAYRDRSGKSGTSPRVQSALVSPQHARALLNLGREYDAQARHNFTTEAVLFCIIVIAAVAWPAIHSLRALAGSF